MKKQSNKTLYILMNGFRVGQLVKNNKGALAFSYDKTWLKRPGARPISLSLPLVEQPFLGDVVYNFFDNLIPDNPQIRTRIQTKFRVETSEPFDLLTSIGRDCVGAIQLVSSGVADFKKEINYCVLTKKEMANLLRDYQQHPLGMTENKEFRISIAGAQEKAAFLYYQGQWCRPLGATPTTHILKLPIGMIPHQQMDLSDSCENEWLCAQIASAFGLPTANCEILYFESVKVLAVERFDRRLSKDGTWLMRLPQEDMCQALGVSANLKYQSDGGPGIKEIMRLLLGSATPMLDRDLFYRAQVLFWLLAAIDGHAKNFSLSIESGGQYRLSPLYDIMSAYPLIQKKQLQFRKIKMAMALQGKNMHYQLYGIQRRHFSETAKNSNYSVEKAEEILDEMLNQVDTVINQVSLSIPKDFPDNIVNPIFEGMQMMRDKLRR